MYTQILKDFSKKKKIILSEQIKQICFAYHLNLVNVWF